jgi:Immunoglobulin I-set domain
MFVCSPTPRVTWTKGGSPALDNGRVQKTSFGQELSFETVEFSDEGIYECSAVNNDAGQPRASHRVQLTVECKNLIILVICFLSANFLIMSNWHKMSEVRIAIARSFHHIWFSWKNFRSPLLIKLSASWCVGYFPVPSLGRCQPFVVVMTTWDARHYNFCKMQKLCQYDILFLWYLVERRSKLRQIGRLVCKVFACLC